MGSRAGRVGVVLDTHVLLCWIIAPDRLSRRSARAVDEADRLGVPAIAFWELSLLVRRGRVELEETMDRWAERVLRVPRLDALPLTPEIAILADQLRMHADPADRFIAATTMVHESPLVSKDQRLRRLRWLETVW